MDHPAHDVTAGDVDERFRKSERLLKRRDFLYVQQRGLRFTTPRLVILTILSPVERRRFGVTVSTKVGNSVVRSRVKRHLRELYRRNKALWPAGHDVVVIARRKAADDGFEALRNDVLRWSAWIRKRQQAPELP